MHHQREGDRHVGGGDDLEHGGQVGGAEPLAAQLLGCQQAGQAVARRGVERLVGEAALVLPVVGLRIDDVVGEAPGAVDDVGTPRTGDEARGLNALP